ncbi:MAG TPA: hypothetical protein PKD09_04865 [Aggregatilinea sp.]|uniref:hypothetical protein n=1 Tax=Aggregatilinea sp. TaxID=2806333 RepID=UPI002BCF3033|nr:hypothetical protein [Aggregatilinea sp.]HML20956.1 hypothetical protein [Aggregatilinea sp.]
MTSTLSPLEPLPQSDDPEFHSFSEDFEHRFFDGAEQVKVEVTLMRETWDDILAVIEDNEWKQNEGLVILLTTGMAFLRAETALSVTQDAAGLSGEEVKKLLDRQMVIEARYASIKNFAFDIMRDHRALEIKHAPIEREYLHYKSMVWPLRRENDALKAENERLKRELQAKAPVTDEVGTSKSSGRWRRFLSALRGRLNHAG